MQPMTVTAPSPTGGTNTIKAGAIKAGTGDMGSNNIGPGTIGAACALTTAFKTDGRIDIDRTADHARRVLESGAKMIAVFGTTGEGASLDLEERRDLLVAMIDRGIQPSRIIVGLAASAIGDAGRQWRLAQQVGAAMVLVPPPFFFKGVSDDGLFRWYADLAEQAGDAACPMLLYTIPSVTEVALSLELIGRLRADFPSLIAGVKDSTGDLAHTERLLAAHGDLQILVGNEADLAAAIRGGASGTISGLTNIVPAVIAGIVATGDDDTRIRPLVEAVTEYPVTPAVKALVAHATGDPAWRLCRAPLIGLGQHQSAMIGCVFDRLFGDGGDPVN